MVQSAYVLNSAYHSPNLFLIVSSFFYKPDLSSQNFAAGFFGIPDFLTNYRQVITIESADPSINNTLNPFCANEARPDIGAAFGANRTIAWVGVYLQDALERIQPLIEGVELDTVRVFEMQEACVYEVRDLILRLICVEVVLIIISAVCRP